MMLHQRVNGSQRTKAPVKLNFWPNVTGQGGEPHLMFRNEAGDWVWLTFDSEDEVRELLSQAHIIHHNFSD